MKKLLPLFALLLIFSSCHTRYIYKNKAEICDNICIEKVIIKHDSVHHYSVDTIFRSSNIDSLLFNAIIGAKEIIHDTIRIHDNNFNAEIVINNGELRAKILHYSDAVKEIIKTNTINISDSKQEVIKVPNPINEALKIKVKQLKWVILSLCLLLVICLGAWIVGKRIKLS